MIFWYVNSSTIEAFDSGTFGSFCHLTERRTRFNWGVNMWSTTGQNSQVETRPLLPASPLGGAMLRDNNMLSLSFLFPFTHDAPSFGWKWSQTAVSRPSRISLFLIRSVNQCMLAALVSWIFLLRFCTMGGRSHASSIFLHVNNRDGHDSKLQQQRCVEFYNLKVIIPVCGYAEAENSGWNIRREIERQLGSHTDLDGVTKKEENYSLGTQCRMACSS